MLPGLESLETVVGYCFRDKDLLRRALTHRSYAHEQVDAGQIGVEANEQLEFLGDAVLGLLVSEALVRRYPSLSEGRLSKLKAHWVSAAHLHGVARKLDLGRYLLLGRGEEMSGGRQKKALLADGVEALLGALYLDGGLEPARAFVAHHILGELPELPAADSPLSTDFKSALQQVAHVRKMPPPKYTTVNEQGPEHSKKFTVEVTIGTQWSGQAEASSKKGAGQKAARLLLEKLMANSDAKSGSSSPSI